MYQTVAYYEKGQFTLGESGFYFKSRIFAQYVPKRKYTGYSNTNWKIHINYPVLESPAKKRLFLEVILGYLYEKDLNHKIVILEKDIFRMNNPDIQNTQNGKIITIYCNSEIECIKSMDELDLIIRKKGFITYYLAENQLFRNDRVFNNNPFIGYRHASTPRAPFFIVPLNEDGSEIEDIQMKYKKTP